MRNSHLTDDLPKTFVDAFSIVNQFGVYYL